MPVERVRGGAGRVESCIARTFSSSVADRVKSDTAALMRRPKSWRTIVKLGVCVRYCCVGGRAWCGRAEYLVT